MKCSESVIQKIYCYANHSWGKDNTGVYELVCVHICECVCGRASESVQGRDSLSDIHLTKSMLSPRTMTLDQYSDVNPTPSPLGA